MPSNIHVLLWVFLLGDPAEPDPPPDPRPDIVGSAVAADDALDGIGPGIVTEPSPGDPDPAAPAGSERRGSFVGLPSLMSNPTFGTGLKLTAAYIVRLNPDDDLSPPSIIGLTGFYTDSDSWLVAAGGKFYLAEDRFRVIAGVAPFDLRYDFYGRGNEAGDNGISIPIRQDGTGYLGEFLVHLGKRFYAGIKGSVLGVHTAIDFDEIEGDLPIDPPDLELDRFDTDLVSLGVHFQRDTRDNQFYALDGALIDLEAGFRDESIGSDFDFEKYTLAYNQYVKVRDADVFAVRGKLCATGGSPPFFGLCQFGQGADLRGYTGGRYRDSALIAVQGEYRMQFAARWAAVGFAGIGGVAENLGDLDFENPLPSAGVGMRFRLSPKTKINIRADYAWGKDETAFYLALGESF